MTLQEDAANCAWSDYRKDYGVSNHEPIRTREHKAFHAGWEAAKAELGHDYHLVKLDELPEVTEHGNGCLIVNQSGEYFTKAMSLVDAKERALRYVALFRHQAARESEAAVLARRRDELARELSVTKVPYDDLMGKLQSAVDRIIAEQDARSAAEDEVARLKGQS